MPRGVGRTTADLTCQIRAAADDPIRMWIFTTAGFLSIVRDTGRPGHVLVRARVREDLDAFCAATSAPAPTETPERDYRFRTSAPVAVLRDYLADQAEAIDYPNFKSAVARRQGSERAHVYGDVWAVMASFQARVRSAARRATR